MAKFKGFTTKWPEQKQTHAKQQEVTDIKTFLLLFVYKNNYNDKSYTVPKNT